jgi:hypothetical protein
MILLKTSNASKQIPFDHYVYSHYYLKLSQEQIPHRTHHPSNRTPKPSDSKPQNHRMRKLTRTDQRPCPNSHNTTTKEKDPVSPYLQTNLPPRQQKT